MIFERRIGRPNKVISVARKGDNFGLGGLDHQRKNARVVAETVVARMPRKECFTPAGRDPRLKKKQVAAIARDCTYGKLLALDRGRSTPIECVAAFLVSVSRRNKEEGRDPSIVPDSLECIGATSLLLDLEPRTLQRALLKLQLMGLVEALPGTGLHLKNTAALEDIAHRALPKVKTGTDEMRAGVSTYDDNQASRRRRLRRIADASSPTIVMASSELREALRLIFVIGGLSVMAVGLAVIAAAMRGNV